MSPSWHKFTCHHRERDPRTDPVRPFDSLFASSLLTRFLSFIESHVPSVHPSSSNVLYPRETWRFPFITTWHKYWTRARQHTTTKHKPLNQHDECTLLSALPVSLPELSCGVPFLGGHSVPTQVHSLGPTMRNPSSYNAVTRQMLYPLNCVVGPIIQTR